MKKACEPKQFDIESMLLCVQPKLASSLSNLLVCKTSVQRFSSIQLLAPLLCDDEVVLSIFVSIYDLTRSVVFRFSTRMCQSCELQTGLCGLSIHSKCLVNVVIFEARSES